MISAFTNIFKIPELRQRVLFTLAMIVIVRAGSAITTPGVNADILREWFRNVADAQSAGGVASLFNLFSGGALAHCAIFSLGIMPYISASIMMQLLTAVIPQLGKLAREDGGRRKIMQYTRYATIALCIFQGFLLAKSFENPQANPFLPGIMDTINRLGMDLVPEPGLGVPADDCHYHDGGDDVPHVVGRPDHRTWHWQWRLADHHRGHPGPTARRVDSSVAHVRAHGSRCPGQC